MTSGPGLGGHAAVAAATALVVGCLAGGALYVSSVRSAALQTQLATVCGTAEGTELLVPSPSAPVVAELRRAAAAIGGLEAPVVTSGTYAAGRLNATRVDRPDESPYRINLLTRTGFETELGAPVPALGLDDVLLPEYALGGSRGWKVGDRISVAAPARGLVLQADGTLGRVDLTPGPMATLTIVGSYPSIPVRPDPQFWCGFSSLYRPGPLGDPAPPLGLVSPATLAGLPAGAVVTQWDVRADPTHLRRNDAERLASGFVHLREIAPQPPDAPGTSAALTGLPAYVARSNRLAELVARIIAPVRLAGALAALVLLAGSALLVARSIRRELRLRVVRGVGPFALWRAQVRSLGPTTVGAAVAGTGAAVAGVRALGPSADLEPAVVRDALAAGAVGWLAAIAVVTSVVTVAALGLVDRPSGRRRVGTRRDAAVAGGLAIVALAIASFLRLDEHGGVRQVGDQIRGGDLLAQAFPMLSALAAVVVLAAPLTVLVRRGRRVGRGLPTGVLLGWRRVTSEPGTSVAVCLATALAVAFVLQANALTDSSQRQLLDKASVYLGADLMVSVVAGPPPPTALEGLGDGVTVVTRVSGRIDSASVDVIGVDPATFAGAAFWRSDAADQPLAHLLRAISPGDGPGPGSGGSIPAVVVGGPVPDGPVRFAAGDVLEFAPVTAARFFPGEHRGSTLFVVDAAVLAATPVPTVTQIWVRHPVADAVARLQHAGVRVTGAHDASEVFAVTTFLVVRWGFDAFVALGALVAAVTLLGQVLVLAARRSSRQVAHVLMRPMGVGTPGEAVAVAIEIGGPLTAGVIIGGAVGWVAARLAVPRLDALRGLEPPAILTVHATFLAGAVLAVAAVIVLLGASGVVSLRRTRTMEVMRAADE